MTVLHGVVVVFSVLAGYHGRDAALALEPHQLANQRRAWHPLRGWTDGNCFTQVDARRVQPLRRPRG